MKRRMIAAVTAACSMSCAAMAAVYAVHFDGFPEIPVSAAIDSILSGQAQFGPGSELSILAARMFIPTLEVSVIAAATALACVLAWQAVALFRPRP